MQSKNLLYIILGLTVYHKTCDYKKQILRLRSSTNSAQDDKFFHTGRLAQLVRASH